MFKHTVAFISRRFNVVLMTSTIKNNYATPPRKDETVSLNNISYRVTDVVWSYPNNDINTIVYLEISI